MCLTTVVSNTPEMETTDVQMPDIDPVSGVDQASVNMLENHSTALSVRYHLTNLTIAIGNNRKTLPDVTATGQRVKAILVRA